MAPAAKPMMRSSLSSGVSLPVISTASAMARASEADSSLRSHHSSHARSGSALTMAAAAATRAAMVALRAARCRSSARASDANSDPAAFAMEKVGALSERVVTSAHGGPANGQGFHVQRLTARREALHRTLAARQTQRHRHRRDEQHRESQRSVRAAS